MLHTGSGVLYSSCNLYQLVLASSYRSLAVHAAGALTVRAESLKEEKYTDWLCEFVPAAVETVQHGNAIFILVTFCSLD